MNAVLFDGPLNSSVQVAVSADWRPKCSTSGSKSLSLCSNAIPLYMQRVAITVSNSLPHRYTQTPATNENFWPLE